MKTVKTTTRKTTLKTKIAAKPAVKKTSAKAAVTTIKAKVDVGFGNNLFVRGQGAGLSWERGTPLVCVDGQTWSWSTPTADKLTFKVLLNDAVWAQGEDVVADPGKQVEISPRF